MYLNGNYLNLECESAPRGVPNCPAMRLWTILGEFVELCSVTLVAAGLKQELKYRQVLALGTTLNIKHVLQDPK